MPHVPGFARFTLACLLVPFVVLLPPVAVGYEDLDRVEVAHTLLRDGLYKEAVSYLRNELQDELPGALRFELQVLLAEALVDLERFAEAEEVLTRTEIHAQDEATKAHLATVRQRLEEARARAGELAGKQLQPADLDETGYFEDEEEAAQPLITNSFFEINIRTVLTDLSMESGIPILWDPTVEGMVTYEAVDTPLENVLASILLPMGYTFSYRDGAYYVGSSRPQDPAFAVLSQTKVVTLSNLEASDAVRLLSDFFVPYVKASDVTNTVCITAPPSLNRRISEDLEQIDAPPQQVSIGVIVAEMSRTAMEKLGIDWSLTHGSTDSDGWSVSSDQFDNDPPVFSAHYLDLDADFREFTADMLVTFEALLQSGDAKVRANPRITTMNGRKAKIGIVRDQYFVIQTGTSQLYQYNTLQSVSSGISLEITPYVSQEQEITVHVKPEVGDVVGKGSEGLPLINTRSASTSIRVRDGETFTIGGLSLETSEEVTRRVPLLGSIPLLGHLFRYREKETRQSEIVIFITPRLVVD